MYNNYVSFKESIFREVTVTLMYVIVDIQQLNGSLQLPEGASVVVDLHYT